MQNKSIDNVEKIDKNKKKGFYQPPNFAIKKTITPSDIKFKPLPLTNNHKKLIEAVHNSQVSVITGFAGTGKTLAALATGLEKVANKEYERVVIYRSTVPLREIGFLPGSEKEKIAPYERPYIQLVQEIFNSGTPATYFDLVNMGVIQFESTQHNQGISIGGSYVIVDEAENLNYKELYNCITRIRDDSCIHFVGDYKKQTVNHKDSGFKTFIDVLRSGDNFDEVSFVDMDNYDDIVRGGIVKKFIINDCEYFNKS